MTARHEAEMALLGMAIHDAASLGYIVHQAEADDFTDEINKAIFEAMKTMHNSHKPVDMVTLSSEYPAYIERIIKLADYFTPSSSASAYIDTLRNMRQREILISGLQKAINAAKENEPGYMGQAQAAIDQAQKIGGHTVAPVGEAALDALERMGKSLYGLKVGIRDLDYVTRGFKPGQLIVLGARPSVGKTSLAMNMALYIATNGLPVAFISLETKAESLIMRAISSLSNMSQQDYRIGTESQKSIALEAAKHISEIPLYICEQTRITSDKIAAYAHTVKQNAGKIGMVVIDYLGLIESTTAKNSTREQTIAAISRRLKLLALELDCPVLLLSQLNRGIEARGEDATPRLSDLRESGALEQDADIVLLLHRDKVAGLVNLNVAKNRDGQTGNIVLEWHPQYFSFADCEWKEYE